MSYTCMYVHVVINIYAMCDKFGTFYMRVGALSDKKFYLQI